jgi:multidrug efflux system membrane fusion protein
MFKTFATIVLFALIGFGAVVTGFVTPQTANAEAPAEQPPMPVSVSAALSRDITEWKEFSGRLRAVADVQVRPRVGGTIDAVHFTEGDTVKKGDKLFTIDPRPYQAALSQAKAALATAEAQASFSRADMKRAKTLIADKSISQREFDEKQSASRTAEAAVLAAKAQIELAQLNVEYAQVLAPVDGRVGRPDVTVGNMVEPGVVVLTTIQSVDPVYADFDIDEQTYLRLVRAVRVENKGAAMPVYMALADEAEAKREGKIKSFDNQLTGSSGALRVRAEFSNPDGLLTPGLFARIRLGSADQRTVVLVNDAAINTDQDRKFVYAVDKDGNVAYRPVTLGAVDGGLRIVETGLSAGETIVVNGLMRVHPGMKVQPVPVSMATLQPDQPQQQQQAPQQQ